ncbi:MAG: PIN domain-containing protein [Candidatus Diapherotrites archaeon]|nr:PIN domain-containing protein [Candidatus Diapherotrites archaeon]
MKLYLDSNVFISFIKEEVDKALNFRYVDSANFFALCRNEKHELIVSDLFFKEVEKIIHLNKQDVIEELVNRRNIKIYFANKKPVKEQILIIVNRYAVHFSDSVHIATAIENNAKFIITWNKKDFIKANQLINSFTPEEFLDIL